MSEQVSQNLASTLFDRISSTVDFTKLPPTARVIVNQAIEKAVLEQSPSIVKSIDETGNQQLTDIPAKIIGPNNPVDLVAKNFNSDTIKGTIGSLVENKLAQSTTNKLLFNVLYNLENSLPPDLASAINLNTLKDNLSVAVLNGVTKGIDSRLTGFVNDLFTKGVIPPQTIPNPAILTGSQIDAAFSSSIASKAFTEARNFNIKAEENQEKLITQTKGFIDPTATYPTKEYSGKSEVNRLAQGEVSGTVVQEKTKERLTGIQLPNGQSWEQPTIPFNAEYPYNKTIQSESGHIVELDDTPGAERIHVYHKSGTFFEIDANGSIVRRTKGSSYEIVDKNGYISITGSASVSVRGEVKVFIGGDAAIEVEGDVNLKCFNDITMQAAGRVDISAKEEINLHSANVNIEADVNLNLKGDVNAFLSSTDINFKANNNIYSQALKSHFVRSKDTFVQTDSTHNIKAGGTINNDGSAFYMQSGTAASSKDSKYAQSSNIGLLTDIRKAQETTTIPDPVQPNYLDRSSYKTEDASNPAEADKQKKEIEQTGIAAAEETTPTVVVESEKASPAPGTPKVATPDPSLKNQTYLPENYQLSKHYTLGMLSSKAAVTRTAVVAQRGLTYGEIVFNLQGVALNILEPILAVFPNMFVTSAFRQAGSSSSTSQHPLGLAVDMQFKGAAKSDYFEIAKKIAPLLKYDQFLLEYKTYGTGMPWIHVSYKSDAANRGELLTFLNDKRHSTGLTSLA